MYLLLTLLSFVLLPLLHTREVPIIPEGPHYYDKPVWELGEYEDLTANVGDTLVFYFIPAYHDVHVFNEDHHLEWAACQFPETDGIKNLEGVVKDTVNFELGGGVSIPINITEANYTFTEETNVYFACGGGAGKHCYDGQKFTVKVVNNINNVKSKVLYTQYKKIPLWTLLGYPDIKVVKGDRLIFKYDPVATGHDVWILNKPCLMDDSAKLLADVDDGAGQGFHWSAKCPNGGYPCSLFIGCSCRPNGSDMGTGEGCGTIEDAGPGPLLHCLSGMGFYVNITRY